MQSRYTHSILLSNIKEAKLNLRRQSIGVAEAEEIANALTQGPLSPNLAIDFGINEMSDAGVEMITRALIANESLSISSINFSHNNVGPAGAKAIAEMLKSGKLAPDIHIDLEANQIGPDGTNIIADLLMSGSCPEKLHINLGFNNIGSEGVKALSQALISEECPPYLQLDIPYNRLTGEDVTLLLAALISGHCPQNLGLNLRLNQLDMNSIQGIAAVLMNPCCPTNLKLNLAMNNIKEEGAVILASALYKRSFPGLQINLSSNELGVMGMQALTDMMLSSTAVTQLTISEPLSAAQELIINYGCLRNQLIQQYPELESFIKAVSYQAGMYKEKQEIFSLKDISARALFFNKEKMPIKHDRLPTEVNAYLAALENIQDKLNNVSLSRRM